MYSTYISLVLIKILFNSITDESVFCMVQHMVKRMTEVNRADRDSIYSEIKDILKGIEQNDTNFEVLYLKYLGDDPST